MPRRNAQKKQTASRRNAQKKQTALKALREPPKVAESFLTGNKRKYVGGFCIQSTRKKLTEHKLHSSSCPICLEDITPQNNVQLNCEHNVCKDCVCRVIESYDIKCPCCRTNIDDLTFENREHFRTLYKICDENWTELTGTEYLDYFYHKRYKMCFENKFRENYRYTWAYQNAKQTLQKNSNISDKKVNEILMRLQFTHYRKLLNA